MRAAGVQAPVIRSRLRHVAPAPAPGLLASRQIIRALKTTHIKTLWPAQECIKTVPLVSRQIIKVSKDHSHQDTRARPGVHEVSAESKGEIQTAMHSFLHASNCHLGSYE